MLRIASDVISRGKSDEKRPLITTYLEMRSPDELRPKRCADARFQIREQTQRDWRFNRDLYFRVGERWIGSINGPGLRRGGKNTLPRRSCGLSPRTMTTHLPVTTNCAATAKAASRSRTSVCSPNLSAVVWVGHC